MSITFAKSLEEVGSSEDIVKAKSISEVAPAAAVAFSPRASAGTETWEYDVKNYDWYNEYEDSKISRIDEKKQISLNEEQINISQEENSQYIPFEMPRYFDGFDLASTIISIHYETSDKYHGRAFPVNVAYSDNKIKFGWLIDGKVTHVAGKVNFEIHAEGKNSNQRAYVWKSKSSDALIVNKSLCIDCDETIVLDDSWVEELVERIAENVATQIAEAQVADQVKAAENAATIAQSAASRAQVSATNAATVAAETAESIVSNKNFATEAFVEEKIADVDISDQLNNYYKKDETYSRTEVDTLIEGVDISEQLVEYALKTEIPIIPDNISAFRNDMGYLTEHQSLEAYATKTEVAEIVEDFEEAIKNVDVDLSDYVTKTEFDTVKNNTVINAGEISDIKDDIYAIQSSLSALGGDNKNLIVQYDEVGSIFHLYERDENGDIVITDGDEEIKVKELYSTIITGAGGGGTALVSTIKLNLRPDGNPASTILYGNNAILNYTLSTRKARETQDEQGNDVTVYEEAIIAGDITLTLYRDNVYMTHFTITKNSAEVQSGDIDVTDYVKLGGQVFTVTASYIEKLGADGETITIRSSAEWSVNSVKLGIDNLPDSVWEATPKYGSTTFSYTPIGALDKTVYFKIDNNEPDAKPAKQNGITLSYTIPQLSHGVHTLEIWCEGNVGGTIVPTEHRKYILTFVEAGNATPIIRIKAPETLEQYSSGYIYYNVFDPLNEIIKSVTIYDEDGVILSSVENITSAEQKWEFRPSIAKDKTITVQYNDVSASVLIKVTEFPYEINPITNGLVVDFSPVGRTNSDADYKAFKNGAYTVEKDSSGEETKIEIPVTWTFSDNFDWINGGWKTDANGDAYFCVKAGTNININYNLFGTDGVVAKQDANREFTIAGTGKEFKLIFKTTNVARSNATWLQCMDIADKKDLGIRMEAQNAYIDSSLGTLEIPYVDDDVIEFDMNIVPMTKFTESGQPDLTTKTIPMVITYEDGTPVQPKVISSASVNFKQDNPKPITIGSEYCDVYIYRMKIYERYLEDKEIITNFIADARSGTEMAQRYLRNDIYPVEDKQRITPESVAAACPDLKVYVISAPYFTNDKKDKVEHTTIKQIHNTGTQEKPEYDANENWTAVDAIHNGQGTSSNEYGYSGRNLEFNMKKATITLNDNVTVVKNIQLSPTSYPTNYLNFKINIASSESANNALLQKRYDRYLPYTSLASLLDDRKKNSMEFFNCVVFVQETNEDIETHREFSDTDIHFYGIGNIGDSKKTDDTRVNDPDDVNEFCVEIIDWNRYLSSFPADTKFPTRYIDNGEEVLRFEDLLIDENLGENGVIYEKDSQGNYIHSKDTTVDKLKTYYIDILEADDFSEDYTYGFRYIQNEYDEKEYSNYKELNAAFQKPLREKWIEFYRFITRDLTTNGVEDAAKVAAWKLEFSDWFILDAALYYYLYTLRYTMVDNRAKNTFWHWGKYYITLQEALDKGIAVYDEDKNPIVDASTTITRFYDASGKEIANINAAAAAVNNGYRMEFWAYDNDTALGIDNAGKLEIPFGVEDADTDAAGVPYFRAHDSTVFVRIAKYFIEELEDMWHRTEINSTGKVFDSHGFINEFDMWQSQFPEELWRIDYERKYKRTYVGGTGSEWDNARKQSNKSEITSDRFLTEMMNGRKKYQRRCFERNQEIYMSSKFKGEVNLGDTITLRGVGQVSSDGKVVPPNFALNIIPFSKMYINLYNATDSIYYHKKCEAGVPCESIPYPTTNLDFIYVRGASQIQSLGDLSPMYLQTAELTAGAKLKEVTLGNKQTGYFNDSLKTLAIGAGNKLLEELDIRNLSNLENTILPVSNIPSLKRVYAQGSNITEASFANSGLLEEAYLPGSIIRLELRNLHYLKVLSLESYDNLLHLTVIGCSDEMNSQVLSMINQATDLQTLRVSGINWKLDDTLVLDRLYSLIKTPNAPEVIISGEVSVPIIRERQLSSYQSVWPDLKIIPDYIMPQFKVTFRLEENGTILEEQYIDASGENAGKAEDPTTRENNPIIPIKESTESHDFIFDGWSAPLINITSDTDIWALYRATDRYYTIRYWVNETLRQETTVPYGTIVEYQGEVPVDSSKESQSIYRWFKGWDKSGFADSDKDLNALFDEQLCPQGYFVGKELANMRPVEIYALTKMGQVSDVLDIQDSMSVRVGNDFTFNDVESQLIISEKTSFNGANHVDTDFKLFEEDRSFVLAIDYEFLEGNANNSVLAQCFQDNGRNGFKLSYNTTTGAVFNWGDSASSSIFDYNSTKVKGDNKREMLVVRHTKGDKNIFIYKSNLDGEEVVVEKLSKDVTTRGSGTLVFGCAKDDEGYYIHHAKGNIYWAKLWFADLGDSICRDLSMWVHEDITFKVDGFRRHYLADGQRKCSFSLLASHLLAKPRKWNSTNTNDGGWAESELNHMLNNRLYKAIPLQIRGLLKAVKIESNDGRLNSNLSEDNFYTSITSSSCYITIPALAETDPSTVRAPYPNEILDGIPIESMGTKDLRKRQSINGAIDSYWLRSPYAGPQSDGYSSTTSSGYYNYIWSIDNKGTPIGTKMATNEFGVLIEISI